MLDILSPILLDNLLYELVRFDIFMVKIRALPDIHDILIYIQLGLLPYAQEEHDIFLLEVILVEYSV